MNAGSAEVRHDAARPTAGTASLSQSARFFWTKPTPKLIAGYLLLAVTARLWIGDLHATELLVPVVILALEPFTEWVIHVVVLHWRPRRLAGRRIDLYAAREHRRHHADPRNLDILFVPMRLLIVQVPVIAALLLLLLPTGLALTIVGCSMAMLLAYEWTHFLVHTPYQPKGRRYRSIWRAHRLHHFRNERYWFGVTTNLADHVLGTFPAKQDVELSPTVRSLGVESNT